LKLKAHIFIAVFLSSSLSNVVYAEPPAEVKWLMNDPVTLFDWGMYQLNLNVKKTADSLKDGGWPLPDGFRVEFGWADYDWKSNKVNLGFLVRSPSQDSKNITSCKKLWHALREKFFLTEGLFYSEKSSEEVTKKLIKRYFSHTGFSRANRPKGIEKALSERLALVVRFDTDDKVSLICETSILGGEFKFSGGAIK
jgi:hypothetical protein